MLIDLSVIGRLARVQRRALTGVGANQQHVERVLLLNRRKLHGVGNLPRTGQRADAQAHRNERSGEHRNARKSARGHAR